MENTASTRCKCRGCHGGRITLFTSVRVCDRCGGTGFDLSDEGLRVPLSGLDLMVRTRKFLARRGVLTLAQLLSFVVSDEFGECGPGVAGNIHWLLSQFGVRVFKGGILKLVPPDPKTNARAIL